jgi:hypothetical protein
VVNTTEPFVCIVEMVTVETETPVPLLARDVEEILGTDVTDTSTDELDEIEVAVEMAVTFDGTIVVPALVLAVTEV